MVPHIGTRESPARSNLVNKTASKFFLPKTKDWKITMKQNLHISVSQNHDETYLKHAAAVSRGSLLPNIG